MFSLSSNDVVKRGKVSYMKDFLTLDTETSHTPFTYIQKGSKKVIDQKACISWVYQWSIASGSEYHMARDITEIITIYNQLISAYGICKNKKLLTYVHNLSYDWNYLSNILIENYGIPRVLANDTHKIISLTFDNGLEFRCSYKLTNKSLETLTEEYDTPHKKLVGYVDYDDIHYSDSILTDQDNQYMYNDTVALHEVIEKQLEIYDDTTATIPYTSTGYVRRLIQRNYRQANKIHRGLYRKEFLRSRINVDLYRLFREEFSGGITHGNRFYAERIISMKDFRSKGFIGIKHRDYDSHYPTQLVIRKYPKKFYHYATLRNNITIEHVQELVDSGKAIIGEFYIKDLKLKDKHTPFPYAQYSKFNMFSLDSTKFLCDNGRVLEMQGLTCVSLNEYDLYWLVKQYDFEVLVKDLWVSEKVYLPCYIIDTIKDLYKQKTELKKKVIYLKESKVDRGDILEAEIKLLIVKALLNAIYGCMATDPVKATYELSPDGQWSIGSLPDIEEVLNKYYDGKKNCLQYYVGCYCTSMARHELMCDIENIIEHGGIPLYCDTDSCFYLATKETEEFFKYQNEEYKKESLVNGWYVTLENGDVKTFHSFDEEKEEIQEFKFLHAKCYGIIDGDELKITVAGVPSRVLNKDGTYTYREDELMHLDNLKDGFTFNNCGGKSCFYQIRKGGYVNIYGHKQYVGNSCVIYNTTKQISNMDLVHEYLF